MTRPLIAVIALSALVSGCMAANPTRPVLSCTDCGSLTYYGPQQPDPRVEMARVLTGGLSSVAGIVVGGDVLKSLGSASGATSTIERTTNNTSDRSAITDRDHSATHIERSNTANTHISNTSVTSTSATTLGSEP